MEEGDMGGGGGGGCQSGNREHGIKREGMHGCRGRISNHLFLFSCTGLTACFFMHTLKGPACLCVSLTWPLTGLGSVVMKRAAGNRCVSASRTVPFDWLTGAALPLQAGRVLLDL